MKENGKIKNISLEGIVKIEKILPNGDVIEVSESENHCIVDSFMSDGLFDRINTSVSQPEYSCLAIALMSKNDSTGVEITGCDACVDTLILNDTPLLPGRYLGFGQMGMPDYGAWRGAFSTTKSINYNEFIEATKTGWQFKAVWEFGFNQAQGGSTINGDNKNTLSYISLCNNIFGPIGIDQYYYWLTQVDYPIRRLFTSPGYSFIFTVNGFIFNNGTNQFSVKKVNTTGPLINYPTPNGAIVIGYGVDDDKYYAWNKTTHELYELNPADWSIAATTTPGLPTSDQPFYSFVKNGNKMMYSKIGGQATNYQVATIGPGTVEDKSFLSLIPNQTATQLVSHLSVLNGAIISYRGDSAGAIFDYDFNHIGVNGRDNNCFMVRTPLTNTYTSVNSSGSLLNYDRLPFTLYKVPVFSRNIDEGLIISYTVRCVY